MIGCRSETLHANNIEETTYALPEKTRRGLPTNKNISIRNMKAQITNMSANENVGFKTEYHVRVNFKSNVLKDVSVSLINSVTVCLI